jgi:hypothetical protein
LTILYLADIIFADTIIFSHIIQRNSFYRESFLQEIWLLQSHHLEVESFRRGAALLENPPDEIEIPFEDYALPAYFFRAQRDGLKHPTLILRACSKSIL